MCGADEGKTTLLYELMFGKTLAAPEPTLGLNNEVITFNPWQSFEFFDVGTMNQIVQIMF